MCIIYVLFVFLKLIGPSHQCTGFTESTYTHCCKGFNNARLLTFKTVGIVLRTTFGQNLCYSEKQTQNNIIHIFIGYFAWRRVFKFLSTITLDRVLTMNVKRAASWVAGRVTVGSVRLDLGVNLRWASL